MSVLVPHASRRLLTELNNLLGKKVTVVLTNGRKYEGTLLGFEHPEYNLVLADAKTEDGETIPRLFIRGQVVAEIRARITTIFDPREFADYIVKKLGLRPDAVRVYEDAGVVTVFNTIRVTAEGVEGSGPMAAKVSYLLKQYLEAKRRGEQPQ